MRKFSPPGALTAVPRRSSLYFSKKTILISVVALLMYAAGYAQNRTPEEKIDPAFRFVLAQPKGSERQIPKTFSPAFKITPTKVVAAAGQAVEERYDCIVYTTDVATVKSTGVLVNSVLPHFVTAWATLEQIEQLSKPGQPLIK
jgi:minor extracellular serine protease Vpr